MKAKIMLFAIMSVGLLLVSGTFAQGARQDLGDLDRFLDALEKDGFDVTPGAVEVLDVATAWCENTPGIENAGYGNKAPYLTLLVPKSVVDQKPVQEFQIRHDEAIVLVGMTPPPEKYFAFYPWLATKVYPDGERRTILNTLGDAVNNLTIKTIGSTPFNSPVALVFTPDKGTDERVRVALQHAGYPAAIINTVVFPVSMLNLGYGETADELRIVMRNAIWQEQADGDAYIANKPLKIFRVTPRTPSTANPLPAPRLRVRGTGESELDLWNKVGELRAGIIAANPGLNATDILSIPAIGYEGYDYMQRGIWEGGDARDAFNLDAGYIPEFGTHEIITLADDEFLMVYGVNHVVTGKATYMSINVYSSVEGKISIGTALDDQFMGTATPYLPGDPATRLMYAYKVSRYCGSESNCLQLGIEDCPRLTIDSNTILGLIFRMYLEPATKVGAAMPEILYDRILKFSPSPQQP